MWQSLAIRTISLRLNRRHDANVPSARCVRPYALQSIAIQLSVANEVRHRCRRRMHHQTNEFRFDSAFIAATAHFKSRSRPASDRDRWAEPTHWQFLFLFRNLIGIAFAAHKMRWREKEREICEQCSMRWQLLWFIILFILEELWNASAEKSFHCQIVFIFHWNSTNFGSKIPRKKRWRNVAERR